MTNQRYPDNLVISAKDFAGSGWKDAIAEATREGYAAMWQALSAAVRSAIEQGRNEHGKTCPRIVAWGSRAYVAQLKAC